MKQNDMTAIQFFKKIKKNKSKFKLINGLFIVQYLNKDLSVFVGEFLKSGSALNDRKFNIIHLINSNQLFNAGRKITYNGLVWKKLNISWKEQDIEEILK